MSEKINETSDNNEDTSCWKILFGYCDLFGTMLSGFASVLSNMGSGTQYAALSGNRYVCIFKSLNFLKGRGKNLVHPFSFSLCCSVAWKVRPSWVMGIKYAPMCWHNILTDMYWHVVDYRWAPVARPGCIWHSPSGESKPRWVDGDHTIVSPYPNVTWDRDQP